MPQAAQLAVSIYGDSKLVINQVAQRRCSRHSNCRVFRCRAHGKSVSHGFALWRWVLPVAADELTSTCMGCRSGHAHYWGHWGRTLWNTCCETETVLLIGWQMRQWMHASPGMTHV